MVAIYLESPSGTVAAANRGLRLGIYPNTLSLSYLYFPAVVFTPRTSPPFVYVAIRIVDAEAIPGLLCA